MSKVYTKYVYKFYKDLAYVLAHKIGLVHGKITNQSCFLGVNLHSKLS